MKKGLLVAVIAVLLLFCLLAVGVGGFLGYRWYKGRAAADQARMEEPALPAEPQGEAREEEPAPPWEERAEPPAPEPQEGVQEEPAPVRRDRPAEAPARPTPAETKPSAPPPPAAAPEPSPVSPALPEPVPSAETAPAPAPAPKVPKGTLGLIFEGKIDEGQVTVTVDGDVWASEPFTASSDRRFRLEKSKNLLPGPHRVRVAVSTPGGKTYEREWTVSVVERRSSVWKAEMNRFPKELEVKPIAQ